MSWTGTNPADWAAQSKRIMEQVLRLSVQDLAVEAGRTIPNGGRVPVKTGNLARSVVVSITPPTIKPEGSSDGNITAGIAAIEIGKPLFIGWQANYSRRLNFGFVGTDRLGRNYSQSGYNFAEATAAKWSSIVDANVAKLRKR